MWGFWERVHWRGRDASIVNDNWTLNEAGRRFESLMNEWTTGLMEARMVRAAWLQRILWNIQDNRDSAGKRKVQLYFESEPRQRNIADYLQNSLTVF